jgi:hypothetical protein
MLSGDIPITVEIGRAVATTLAVVVTAALPPVVGGGVGDGTVGGVTTGARDVACDSGPTTTDSDKTFVNALSSTRWIFKFPTGDAPAVVFVDTTSTAIVPRGSCITAALDATPAVITPLLLASCGNTVTEAEPSADCATVCVREKTPEVVGALRTLVATVPFAESTTRDIG